MSEFSRRRFVGLSSLQLATLVALKSGGTASAQNSTPPATSVTEFPITIETVNGTVEITAPGAKVVALSYQDVDTVVALGVTPIGVQQDYFTESGIPVWLEDSLDAAGTTVLEIPEQLPFEEIIQLGPDLILDTFGTRSQPVLDQLNEIAPTVSGLPEIEDSVINDRTRLIGSVLGKSTEAEEVIAAIDDEISAFATDHADLQGKTFAFGVVRSADVIGVITADSHFLVELLSRFGMDVAPALLDDDLLQGGFPGSFDLSWEQIHLLDSDVLLMGFGSPELQEQFESSQLYAGLSSVERGNVLALDLVLTTALNVPSVGNIPWTLAQLREMVQQLDFIGEA